MEAINFTAYTQDASQVDAIKAFMKALKIKFELSKEEAKPYNEAFVKKIKQGDEDLKNGKGRTVTLEELDSLWK
jgi:DNA/RNA-binding domain of Phe-tRNA-synthetase-like protein